MARDPGPKLATAAQKMRLAAEARARATAHREFSKREYFIDNPPRAERLEAQAAAWEKSASETARAGRAKESKSTKGGRRKF